MTDLDVMMDLPTEAPAPTSNDKRLIDNFDYGKPLQSNRDDFEEEEVKVEVKEEPILEVKPVISDKVVFGTEEGEEPPSPKAELTHGKETKKQVASNKQREHLKKAREKALETRRAKSAHKKLVEEEKKAERQKKREEKEKAMIEKEEQEHKLKKQVPTSEPVVKQHSYMNQLTQEQLIELQQKAIENYEIKRKSAKKIKKEQIAKDTADKKIYESISKAIGPTEDAWDSCFN